MPPALLAVLVALWCLIVPAGALAGTAPAVVGATTDAVNMSGTTSVSVSGGFAYATAYHAGELAAVNVSNPAAPVLTTTGAAPLQTNLIGGSNVAIAGGYAFVVSKNRNASTSSNDDGNGDSLTILDVHTDPAHPAVVGHIRDTGKLFGAYGVAVSGGYAYVAYQGVLSGTGQPLTPDTSLGGFTVINITDPTGPAIVANIDNPPSGTWTNAFKHSTSVQVSGHYAYVSAFNDDRLTVVDISNPSTPTIVASLRDATNLISPADVAVQGNYAYVANQNGGGLGPEFTVVNIADPLHPTVIGSVTNALLQGAYRIRARGNFAYVAARSASAVVAIDISDPTHPRLVGSVQDAGHLNATTGLDLDATGRYVVASSPYLSTESNATYPAYPDAGGPTNTGTVSVIDMVPNAIAATIAPASEPPNPTTQTTASFTFSSNDDVSVVACSLDGATPGPCTSPTTQSYSGLAPGSHTFTVQATDSSGHTASASYTWAVQQAPANTTAPSTTGTASLGQTLTASPGVWSGYPAPSYSYVWERCDQSGSGCSAIGNATSQAYTATRADVGSTLVVAVTGTNAQGSAQMASGASAIVTGAPQNTGTPTVGGTASLGQTLTASPGAWSGYPAPSFTYAWERCDQSGSGCSAISGATSQTYVATRADVGSTLAVAVTGTNGLGSAPGTSGASAIVTGAPQNSALPSISGYSSAPDPGVTLTASPGTWSAYPAPTFAYQWQRCTGSGTGCTNLATGQTYTPTGADTGSTLVVVVTATNGQSPDASATSAATPVVTGGPQNTALPTVSGTASQGQTLTASPGTWTGSPAPTFTYAWQRCAQDGTGCAAISGATGQTYTLARGDVASTLEVQVTGTSTQGTATATSATSAIVTGAPQNTGTPAVGGTASLGQTLTASPGAWSGYPAPSFTYVWERCDQAGAGCSAISGATSQSYSTTRADVASTLVVLVTGTNGLGSAPGSSSASAIVTGAPQNTGQPGVSGTPAPGQTLTASPGTWSAYPAPTFTYAWQRCAQDGSGCVGISGATGQSYVLTGADTGSTLVVAVTASNGQSPDASATSAATSVVTGAPQNTALPTVSGTASQGQTLTASPGTWTGSPAPTFTYAWQRCSQTGTGCAAISGATGQTYTLARGDVGSTLEVQVTGTSTQGTATATSATTSVVTGGPQNTAPPAVGGSAAQGQTLTASPGTWTGYPAPTFTYAWQRCAQNGTGCLAIAGATAQTYTLTRADVGATIKTTVTAANTSGSVGLGAGPTAIVTGPPSSTAPPVITGKALVGNTLTATLGTWTGYPTPTLTEQWQRCNTNGELCQAISGATTTSYTVTSADVGTTIRFLVHGVNTSGSALGRSAQTALVAVSGSAIVHGLSSGQVSLRITAFAPRPGTALTKLTIKLPTGLSLGHLGSGVRVTAANGHKLRFTAKVVHGTLTITLRKPASSVVVVVVASGAINETPQLARAARAKRQKRLSLTLTLAGTHGLAARDPLKVTVAS